jgi:hypothetical protein
MGDANKIDRRTMLEQGATTLGVLAGVGAVAPEGLSARASGTASPRGLAPRLQELDWINVKDHGAVGDGTTDDTAAIQAAIDATGGPTPQARREGGVVYLPQGDYVVSAPLVINRAAVTITGAAPNRTMITPSASFSGEQLFLAQPTPGRALFIQSIAYENFVVNMINVSNVTTFRLRSVRNTSHLHRIEVYNQDGTFLHIDRSDAPNAAGSEGVSTYDCVFLAKLPKRADGIIIAGNEMSLYSTKLLGITAEGNTRGVVLTTEGSHGASEGFRMPGSSIASYSTGLRIEGPPGGPSAGKATISGATLEECELCIDIAGVDASHLAQEVVVMGNRYLGIRGAALRVDYALACVIIESPAVGNEGAWEFTENAVNNIMFRRFSRGDKGDVRNASPTTVVFGPVLGVMHCDSPWMLGGSVEVAGGPGGGLRIAGERIVGDRISGWQAPSGSASRSAFNTGSVSTRELAERVKALIDDLASHGLIGT